jgi:hypothetical protein
MAALRLCAFLAGATAAFSSQVVAGARPRDAAVTGVYLKAKDAELRAELANYPADIKAIEAFGQQLSSECPGVLAGAPHHVKRTRVEQPELEISEEVLSVVLGTAEHTEHSMLRKFARTVARLHWQDRRLTRLVHSFANEQAAQSILALPNLCADLKAWVASAYRTVPASTKQFLHRQQVVAETTLIEAEPHEPFTLDVNKIIARRLAPYEDQGDRATGRRISRLEDHVRSAFLKGLLEAAGKAIRVLETPTTPSK